MAGTTVSSYQEIIRMVSDHPIPIQIFFLKNYTHLSYLEKNQVILVFVILKLSI